MKTLHRIGAFALLLAAATGARSDDGQTLVVTASNATTNQLLVYDANANLIQTIATKGQGGVSGNAGGIATEQNQLAVVNFGSTSVSLFERTGNGFELRQVIPAASSPVSVAFGNNHLYILGATEVESHQMFGSTANSNPDGMTRLIEANGSAAQVGVLPGQLIITEKSIPSNANIGAIETVSLRGDGAVGGPAAMVTNIPPYPNSNTPFGLVTRGNDAYVTIAHSNEISLVRNGALLTVTGSGSQNAPCWLTLDGPFLFSSNSPSMSVSRYAVYGQKIVQDAAVAASLNGDPTDITHRAGLVAVIDGGGHLSIFSVDEDGNLTVKGVAGISSVANGVAIVPGQN
jgi:hypothetical protein